MRVMRGYPGQGSIKGFDSSVKKRLLGRATAEPIRSRRAHDVLGHGLLEHDRLGDLWSTLTTFYLEDGGEPVSTLIRQFPLNPRQQPSVGG
jgi:hypothetical protein